MVADDGTPLAAHEFGSRAAALTVVFVHGHCLRAESWSFLRGRLSRHWGAEVRMVCYDHRGHGESGSADPATYTIDQLARDLDAVLRALVPDGPVVLVGHSMGAMVTLAYARLFPHMIGARVVGLGLIAGAASGVTAVGLGRLLNRWTVTSLQLAVRRAPRLVEASQRLSRQLAVPMVRNARGRAAGPRLVAAATVLLNEASPLTMASFLDSLRCFDETATLCLLAGLPVLVLGGSADLVVPFAHSVVLASQLPGAELVRLDGAGHSVILDRAEQVAAAVAALVERVIPASAPGCHTALPGCAEAG
ncbi:alpha/beta fold hydrolase [Nocardia sp. alder85J]|uniref:alpha/beta fold hydrolase n=1 Tax=Nocardia sp. alder85J TaxID=2862949 RepID=UPI001CD2F55D|nr:alpha/beta hydrolase [Nocardia sp. alder85J]MCX4096434.1 alpha/beta hydrolase [Nocardia sp. alder85J]